jgi:hypothetical protein
MSSSASITPFPWTEWENPSAAYRGKPLWSWNRRLEPAELIRQIGIFKEMGLGGYFMRSRTGLQTPCLGREWFGCIKTCTDAGEALGLESWLYEQDRSRDWVIEFEKAKSTVELGLVLRVGKALGLTLQLASGVGRQAPTVSHRSTSWLRQEPMETTSGLQKATEDEKPRAAKC